MNNNLLFDPQLAEGERHKQPSHITEQRKRQSRGGIVPSITIVPNVLDSNETSRNPDNQQSSFQPRVPTFAVRKDRISLNNYIQNGSKKIATPAQTSSISNNNNTYSMIRKAEQRDSTNSEGIRPAPNPGMLKSAKETTQKKLTMKRRRSFTNHSEG